MKSSRAIVLSAIAETVPANLKETESLFYEEAANYMALLAAVLEKSMKRRKRLENAAKKTYLLYLVSLPLEADEEYHRMLEEAASLDALPLEEMTEKERFQYNELYNKLLNPT